MYFRGERIQGFRHLYFDYNNKQYAKYCDYNIQYSKRFAFPLRLESNRHRKQSGFLNYE